MLVFLLWLRPSSVCSLFLMSTISQVMGVLKVWESWGIYPPIYLTGLEATFRRRSIDVDSLVIPPEELAQLEERKIHVLREVRTDTHLDPLQLK